MEANRRRSAGHRDKQLWAGIYTYLFPLPTLRIPYVSGWDLSTLKIVPAKGFRGRVVFL